MIIAEKNNQKHLLCLRRIKYLKFLPFSCLLLSLGVHAAANTHTTWYRYYDQRGIANISSSVTPAHIRYGYESLDQNMQVIARTPAYNTHQDLKQASQREVQARQKEYDLKLKRAYGNSKTASIKRDEILGNINKQMIFQQQQLKQQQNERIIFKNQENQYLRQGQHVPQAISAHLTQNELQIDASKETLRDLQNHYRTTQIQYTNIIERLKKIE